MTERGSSRSHPCHDLQGTTWNSAAITGGAFTLTSHPPAPLMSHPDPHPQVGVKAQPQQSCAPTPGRRPSPSHQCRRLDALQCVCVQTSSLLARHGPAVSSPLAPGPGGVDDDSSTDSGRGGWFRDGSSILPLLCTSFLGHCYICSQRLGTPDLDHGLRKGASVHALHHLRGARHAAAVR